MGLQGSTTGTREVRGTDPATGRPIVVEVQGGGITAVREEPHGEQGWLSAGLVDLQVNGFEGHDLNGSTLDVDTVHALAQAMARGGVTTFLPTLITAPEAQLLQALAVIAQARRAHPLVAHMVPGIHVEGPALAPEDGPRGVHPLADVRPPSLDEYRRWQVASEGLVSMVTLSPHWPQTVPFVQALAAAGVCVALGHTNATAAQIDAAVDAGARLSTHLGNGMHARLDRRHNPLWAQLADDRLSATFIADGHHLVPQALQVMLRAKGLERSMIVSDATAIGGMPPGRYEASVGGAVHLSDTGRLSPGDGTGDYLAGAALPLLAGVGTLVRQAKLSLADALALATVHPGRHAGGRGRLAVGEPADLLQFAFDAAGDAPPQVLAVWVQGEPIA